MGTPYADTIRGFGSSDVLRGAAGPDQLYGGDAGDELYGGKGDDWLQGKQGPDLVEGRAGDDELWGYGGGDILRGGTGRDYLVDQVTGEFGGNWPNDRDRRFGGRGADLIAALDGPDSIQAGSGNDQVRVERDGFADTIRCGDGRDDVLRNYGPRDWRDSVRGCERIRVFD